MPKVSVKVMRSYDYCHFEVCLSSDEEMTLIQANEMRKDAARLTDEAVRQYKIAKEKLYTDWTFKKTNILKRANEIREKKISDWTSEEKAVIKFIADKDWAAQWDYDEEE